MKKIIGISLCFILLIGCTTKLDTKEKIRDLDFFIVEGEHAPEELRAVLEEKKVEPFKLTHEDEGTTYLCIGYGEQSSGGYSIAINDLYLSENAVYFDTNLIGPKVGERKTDAPSYPYIIVQIESLDMPVVFQ